MADSRITQAHSSVKAALDAITDADNAVTELLREDPAFGAGVQLLLTRAIAGNAAAVSRLMPTLRALRQADEIENSPVGVRP